MRILDSCNLALFETVSVSWKVKIIWYNSNLNGKKEKKEKGNK